MIGVIIYVILQAGHVRPRIRWMARADDYILELLDEAGIAANPSTIGYNTDYDTSYVSERCRKLSDGGLLVRETEKRAMYSITDLGRRYVHDELTDDEEAQLQDAL